MTKIIRRRVSMELSARYIKTIYKYFANFFIYPLLALSILLPATSSALEKEETITALSGLHHAQVQSFFAINAFYNFSANDGDKALLGDVNEAINEVNSAMNSLEQFSSDENLKDEIAEEITRWQTYKTTLNTIINDILDQGYADLRLMADLATMNQEFTNALANTYAKLESEGNYKPNATTSMSRNTALLMAAMMTKYSARTTSNVSQIFQGSDTEKTIDVLAQDFDKQLRDLLGAVSGEQKQTIESVITKWEFIKNSYMNYNEKNVNYVVNLYSKRIIDALESTADSDQGA